MASGGECNLQRRAHTLAMPVHMHNNRSSKCKRTVLHLCGAEALQIPRAGTVAAAAVPAAAMPAPLMAAAAQATAAATIASVSAAAAVAAAAVATAAAALLAALSAAAAIALGSFCLCQMPYRLAWLPFAALSSCTRARHGFWRVRRHLACSSICQAYKCCWGLRFGSSQHKRRRRGFRFQRLQLWR